MTRDYDVIVIGAGPGGYVAAIRAAQLGLKTAVVEREHLGGICLNWGCIPTKALLRSADLLDQMREAKAFGITAGEAKPDIAAIVKRSRAVSAQLNGGIGMLLKKNKVDVIWGEARFKDAHTLDVAAPSKKPAEPAHPAPKAVKGPGRYSAEHIIVATGARPRALPGLEPDGDKVLTYFEAMVPKEVPKSLLVMGSGAIGVEFGSFYRSLGTEVTIVELLPQILPHEDEEVAAFARKRFEKRGMRVLTGTKATKLDKSGKGVTVTLEGPDGKTETVTVDKVISAIGVATNTENLGLESIGVKTDRGGIVTDGLCRTNVAGVYAIGDVAGAPMLAHKAEHEGILCVEAIAGKDAHALDKTRIPGCTYCHPQVASVGLTEKAAKDAGRRIRVGKFPFIGNGKAVALGDTEGFVKTVFDDATGELLGAHMVGPEVTELIQGFATAISHETTEEHLMQTVYPHPTLSEAMHESVLSAYGRAIHI
ncbi:dihydrolipoyl dehydrogenase [Rhodobium gokarnense]|uniref:Dihydrolipoyl dehydrogenase n=1 Tax=Rhodobium gokarnense TaxID=364296 RepID=A0ABT3H868_9HYPH|nr:dihydrolipoyl dehydrogenase [Rhodobium gokarnense]MCW2306592.1 dihydrolipoamide dehydrogenase [Rhodobium gokarnense]